MLSRTKLVPFYQEFIHTNLAFDEKDWASCLLFMAQNIDDMPEPIQPDLDKVLEFNDLNQESSDSFPRIPEGVLLSEIQELKLKLKAKDETISR